MDEKKKRVSNQRACIALTLHRAGLADEVIKRILDGSYALNIECKENNINPYDLLIAETTLRLV